MGFGFAERRLKTGKSRTDLIRAPQHWKGGEATPHHPLGLTPINQSTNHHGWSVICLNRTSEANRGRLCWYA